jgi:hypothetical protein
MTHESVSISTSGNTSVNPPVNPAHKAFLLRCRQQPTEPGKPSNWRYAVQEVAAGAQERQFLDWLEVTDFIAARMKQSDSLT